jgi:hypothetical protein
MMAGGDTTRVIGMASPRIFHLLRRLRLDRKEGTWTGFPQNAAIVIFGTKT